MAERLNAAARNLQADSIGTDLNSGTMEIRTGAQPASGDDAASGTLLVTINLPADAFDAAVAGVAVKAGTWTGTAVATGVAGWYRKKNSGATRNYDGAIKPQTFLDGAINSGVTTITVDDTTAFPSTGTLKIDSEEMTYTGKTGTTFTGLTRGANSTVAASHGDNAVVQGQDAELGLDNTQINSGQVVTISAYQLVQPAE